MIRVFDNGGNTSDRYTVKIKADFWFMSDNADSANGVCMYGGEYQNDPEDKEISLTDLPKGARRQIANLRRWYY